MITYKVEKQTLSGVNTEIRNLARKVAEDVATLKALQDSLAVHQSAIATPSLNAKRQEIDQKVHRVMVEMDNISKMTMTVTNVSEQTGKHLIAIEEQIGRVLSDEQPVSA